MIGIYYRKLKQCTRFSSWFSHVWRLPVRNGVIDRERGTRILGIEVVWFRTKADRAEFEK